MTIRSLLFAPANRHDLIAKFPAVPADVFALDLEDGTPAGERDAARRSLGDAVAAARAGNGGAGRVMVRVNPVGTADFARDCAALAAVGADGIVLAKAERAEDVVELAARVGALPIVAGVESIAGVVAAQGIAAAPQVEALYFGAEDFIAEMGGVRTRSNLEVLHVRSAVVLAARAAGVGALDQVVFAVRDDERFTDEAAFARTLGYTGKMCVTPRQVPLANAAFRPSGEEIERARRLVAAYEAARAQGQGTINFEGSMVDGPVLKQAQAVLRAAE